MAEAESWVDSVESRTLSGHESTGENKQMAIISHSLSLGCEHITETTHLLLPNPLLNKVKKRPGQLDLSASGPAPRYTQQQNRQGRTLSEMNIREKLLLGVSMSMRKLQQNPALFDKLFPPPPSAIPPHITGTLRNRKPSPSRKRKLSDIHDMEMEMLDDEEREERRFEIRMNSV